MNPPAPKKKALSPGTKHFIFNSELEQFFTDVLDKKTNVFSLRYDESGSPESSSAVEGRPVRQNEE